MAVNPQTEEDENYWPGYVDALTTMTMVLTFIMMVLGVMVFILSQDAVSSKLGVVARALPPPLVVTREGDTVVVKVEQRLVVQVGAASIELREDGRVTVRGRDIVTEASRNNRMRGAMVLLN